MTTLPLRKFTQFTGLTLSISLFAVAVATGIAGEPATGKGGAAQLMNPQPPVSAPARNAMACPTCKSEYVARKDLSARGATKPTQIIERHLCPGCDTKMTMAGAGKARSTVAMHQCTAAPVKTMACCAQ